MALGQVGFFLIAFLQFCLVLKFSQWQMAENNTATWCKLAHVQLRASLRALSSL